MNNVSWRHHYIPEFYLRGFTNSQGAFKIYDVERKAFVKDGKEFSPESHFFEKHANTIFTEKGADDFIETKFYSRDDNRIADLLNIIKSNTVENRFGLTEDDMPALQHFVSVMYWRLPVNYDEVKYLIRNYELHELGLLLVSKTTGKQVRDEEFEHRIRTDPNFFKAVRHFLPYITYKKLLECRTPLTIQPFPEQLPAICSDNPIIFEKTQFPEIYYDDFIFPLSHTLVFIRGNLQSNFLPTIKIDIDLIVLKQAKKYVSCTDERYISMLNKYYSSNFSSIDEVKRKVFNSLLTRHPRS
jgi:hypothetical protein